MRNMDGTAWVAAVLVFAVSAVAFGASVVDAVRTGEPGRAASPVEGSALTGEPEMPAGAEEVAAAGTEDPAVAETAVARGEAYPLVGQDEILEAVNQDLFQPDRTPPPERYVLPSQRLDFGTSSRNDRRRREPNLRIVGTAIAGDLALALVQVEDSIPFALLLGEEVDGYRLAAVDEESATLTDETDEFTFPVTEPDRGRSSNARSRNARGNEARVEEAAQALEERVQQMLQQMGRGQMGRGGVISGVQLPLRLQELQRAGELPPNVIIRTRPGGGGGGSRP